MMMSGLKNQFWIDACASTREVTNQITSVPTLVHMIAPSSGWTFCNQHHKMKAVFNYKELDFSDISSDLPDIMITMSDADIPDLADVSDAVWFI